MTGSSGTWSEVAGAEPEPSNKVPTITEEVVEATAAEPTRLTLLILPYGYGHRAWSPPRDQAQPRQRWARPYWDDRRFRYGQNRPYRQPWWRQDYARRSDMWRDRDGQWAENQRWRNRQYEGRYGPYGGNWRSAGRYDRDRW